MDLFEVDVVLRDDVTVTAGFFAGFGAGLAAVLVVAVVRDRLELLASELAGSPTATKANNAISARDMIVRTLNSPWSSGNSVNFRSVQEYCGIGKQAVGNCMCNEQRRRMAPLFLDAQE